MSKVKELATAIDELHRCGEALIDVAETLKKLFSGSDNDQSKQDEPTRVLAQPVPSFSLENVRAALLQKTRAGFKDAVKELLRAHGAERLPDIDPSEYSAIMSEAEGIGQ